NAANGEHQLKRLVISDNVGNRQTLLPSMEASAKPLASVQVDSEKEDTTGPTFNEVKLKNTKPIQPGDIVSFDLSLDDDLSGVATGNNSACVVFTRTSSRDTKRVCGSLERTEKEAKRYHLDIQTDPLWYRATY